MLANTLIILFDEYFNNSKFNYLSLIGSSIVARSSFVALISLEYFNVFRAEFDSCDETKDYKEYLSKSKVESEISQLDFYSEGKKTLGLNIDIDILDY